MSFDPQKTWPTIVLTRYRHSFLGTYREAGAWIKVFPIMMVGASSKAFSASQGIRKFFYTVCLDVILVETGVFYQWQFSMGAMGAPDTIPFHVGGVKVAGWSARCWQSHADLRNCKRQFHGFLWNWRFLSFRPVDWVLWGSCYNIGDCSDNCCCNLVVRTVS